jgi:mannose-6-phosphate isomerase-like protein (cupin superfamily)
VTTHDEFGGEAWEGTAMREYVGPIEKQTLEIGDEVHQSVDQFFRIEEGEARFVFHETQERLVRDGEAVVVPAGTFHNVINTSKTALLKLYTLYAPPNHPDGTIHKTMAEAEAAEALEHH